MTAKNVIYYFTGTGNSLATARAIATGLGPSELIPIAKVWQQNHIVANAPNVGFVCPLYFSGLPAMVAEFVPKLDLSKAEYIWAVVTRKSSLSGGALPQLSGLLKAKGKRLDAGFYINMVGNYVIKYDVPMKELQKITLSDAGIEAGQIAERLARRARKRHFALLDPLWPLLHRKFAETVHQTDEGFFADDDCNGCRICVQVCPVDNIVLRNERPQWQHRCQSCLACLHWCPEQAIQHGEKSVKHRRYQHPYVNVRDIMAQK